MAVNKSMLVLIAVAAATSYSEVEAATGISRSRLGRIIHHLASRGLITKNRACRCKAAAFTITERGSALLAGRKAGRRERSSSTLQAIWPSVVAAERLGFEPFDYCERS